MNQDINTDNFSFNAETTGAIYPITDVDMLSTMPAKTFEVHDDPLNPNRKYISNNGSFEISAPELLDYQVALRKYLMDHHYHHYSTSYDDDQVWYIGATGHDKPVKIVFEENSPQGWRDKIQEWGIRDDYILRQDDPVEGEEEDPTPSEELNDFLDGFSIRREVV